MRGHGACRDRWSRCLAPGRTAPAPHSAAEASGALSEALDAGLPPLGRTGSAARTLNGMSVAGDAYDARLLASRDYAPLLAKYWPLVQASCVAALRGGVDAEDVAQNVLLRLCRELHAGKRYRVEFERVVRNVTSWTIKQHFHGQ